MYAGKCTIPIRPIGQIFTNALPTRSDRLIHGGFRNRLSAEFSLLSPITKYESGGTLIGACVFPSGHDLDLPHGTSVPLFDGRAIYGSNSLNRFPCTGVMYTPLSVTCTVSPGSPMIRLMKSVSFGVVTPSPSVKKLFTFERKL